VSGTAELATIESCIHVGAFTVPFHDLFCRVGNLLQCLFHGQLL
jgi:hypothetical protein